MTLDVNRLKRGEEQFEFFDSTITGRRMIQYDYRAPDGKLFSSARAVLVLADATHRQDDVETRALAAARAERTLWEEPCND